MFDKKNIQKAHLDGDQPLLTVVIDTEEEFDWAAPFDRDSRSVNCISHQYLAQDIFRKHNIIPTYVIDHAVAEDDTAVGILREWMEEGGCLIGTHLHPWINPPYEEEVCVRNSYPGNLPYELEKAKLETLTDLIERKTGRRPVIYKAGRYGAGPNTGRILAELGYEIDTSVVADTDFSHDTGPDFRGLPVEPYYFEYGNRQFLELPNSRGYDGLLARWGSTVYPLLAGQSGLRSLMAGVLSKLTLLERIPLTPEGIRAEDHIRMTRRMHAIGHKVFNYAYHSSSLMIGGSPYVKDQAQLDRFLEDMDVYFSFFMNDLGGRSANPLELQAMLVS
ncbi:polysaccharide deacetylase family protein [Emcibacter sp.]|uniref:polysaccharide deacetylase family protein n=1 Tax=Emcibacter sp. TaxID=1979954 RepID=UPI003A8EDAC9